PPPPPPMITWRAAVMGVFLLGFVATYFYFATQLIYQTNQNRLKSDQQHNINQSEISLQRYAARDGEWWYRLPHLTDGVVNPLWPYVAGHLAWDGDHREYFRRGKWLNVVWAGVFCVGLGVVMALRRWSLLGVMNLVLLAGFGALVLRATFFQPEPLYYVFFFIAWVCCLRLLWRNPLWLYGVLGLSGGLAYLAKSSVQPLLAVFVGVTVLKLVWLWWEKRKKGDGEGESGGGDWSWRRHLAGLGVLVVVFLGVSSPRLIYAEETYGSGFHSYPGYWMWMDSFPDGVVFMQTHGSKEALEGLAAEERPSAGNYLRTHSAGAFWERLTSGTGRVVGDFFAPSRVKNWEGKEMRAWKRVMPGRGWYLGWLAAILGILAAAAWWRWRGERKGEDDKGGCECGGATVLAMVFVAGTVGVYALAYGWYVAIGKGDRFMMALYLPLVFTLLWGCEALVRRAEGQRWVGWFYGGASGVLLAAIFWRLGELMRYSEFAG
ncbi:MAG: hypothetical protein AAF591_22630, partial [Verrucomicrobiota bacterium]